MHFFRGSKHSSTITTTTITGDDGGSNSSGNGDSVTPRARHKSVDNFFALPNFLARSISRKISSSPERVPRRNEFDMPSFLSRSRSTARRLERGLSRSRSAVKRNDLEAERLPEAATHKRSQSTTRRDWFSSIGGGGGGGGRDEGSGSSRSKSSTRRPDDDGGSSRSRSTIGRRDPPAVSDDRSSRSKSTTRQPEPASEGSGSSRSKSTTRRPTSTARSEPASVPETLSRSTSRRSNIPIMFSNSRGKPPPVERTLECSLEDLLFGCVKKVLITRDVVSSDGSISQEQEMVRIKVKPGWRQGTKITFEGLGDEQPGTLPADIVFSIAETRHNLYRREGDDLVMAIEIPLVKALTGCTLSIPLLGGEKANVRIDDVIYPGYERILKGQGMPSAKDKTRRGNLRLRFHVAFPGRLSRQQRFELYNLLQAIS